jgi:bacterial/archaeal transporter family-2 protein
VLLKSCYASATVEEQSPQKLNAGSSPTSHIGLFFAFDTERIVMNSIGFSTVLALLTGALIAVQSSWSGLAGKQLGAFNANLVGLVLGGTLSLFILAVKRGVSGEAVASSFPYIVGLSVSSILIGASISFVVQRVGVTTSLAGLLVGQLLTALLIDTLGWSGVVIPLETKRIIGLFLLGVAVYLVVPRA